MRNRPAALLAACAALLALPLIGRGRRAELHSRVFKGSALTGWQPLGNAAWRAENGEIVGTPKGGGRTTAWASATSTRTAASISSRRYDWRRGWDSFPTIRLPLTI